MFGDTLLDKLFFSYRQRSGELGLTPVSLRVTVDEAVDAKLFSSARRLELENWRASNNPMYEEIRTFIQGVSLSFKDSVGRSFVAQIRHELGHYSASAMQVEGVIPQNLVMTSMAGKSFRAYYASFYHETLANLFQTGDYGKALAMTRKTYTADTSGFLRFAKQINPNWNAKQLFEFSRRLTEEFYTTSSKVALSEIVTSSEKFREIVTYVNGLQ